MIDLQHIAAAARPLWKRVPPVGTAPANTAGAAKRMAEWRGILGSETVLQRRLKSCPLTPNDCALLLGGQQAAQPLPRWTATLSAVVERAGGMAAPDRACHARNPLPFEDVLLPFLQQARADLAERIGAAQNVLRPKAIRQNEHHLLAHLTYVANKVLGQEFYLFRFAEAPMSALHTAWQAQPDSTQIYARFVQHMREGGLAALFERYPVLARLLAHATEQWVGATIAICQNIAADIAAICAFFGWPEIEPQGCIAELKTGLSDRHRGGRSVAECRLSTGQRLIYKPRTVSPEAAYARVIDWVNRQGMPLELGAARALDRGDRGWVEHVPHQSCNTVQDVADFHVRAGMTLAVLHVLAVSDVHCENLIASGAQPYVIDLETLLTETVDEVARLNDPAHRPDGDALDPLMHVGMLPRWQDAPDGQRFDMSALGADFTQDEGLVLDRWERVNTDQMHVTEETRAAVVMTHRVALGRAWPDVSEHIEAFLEGFDATYRCFLAKRDALLDDGGLTAALDGLELRIILRNTTTYARLLHHLLHPDSLRCGIDRSLQLEWLARPLGAFDTPHPGRAQIYTQELVAMEALDIPHFSVRDWHGVRADSSDPDIQLMCHDRDSRVLRRRLASLSLSDLAEKRKVIAEAVAVRFGP